MAFDIKLLNEWAEASKEYNKGMHDKDIPEQSNPEYYRPRSYSQDASNKAVILNPEGNAIATCIDEMTAEIIVSAMNHLYYHPLN